MREIDYRTVIIPSHLNSEDIKKEYELNISKEKYVSKNTPYNDSKKTVKNSLKELYHNKCAYCESSLYNAHGHIEHYRPKKASNLTRCDSSKGYYWLAFSWDNLIPCCEICNGFKSNCFDTINAKIDFEQKDSSFESLHKSLREYNKKEEPKLLHPEIDRFENSICFRKKGQLLSKNRKVRYTLRVCKLNRINLREEREKIITKWHNNIKEFYSFRKKFNLTISNLSDLFYMRVFDKLNKELQIKNSYSLVSSYIYNNFNIFLQDNSKLEEIDKKIINQLWVKYKKEHDV